MQKRLYRSKKDRMFFGVCAGVAEYFGIDPTIVRLIWAALSLVGFVGVIAYALFYLIVPEDTTIN